MARESTEAIAGSARTTSSSPSPTTPARARCRHCWRSFRVTAWRTTALPTALETTKPNRGPRGWAIFGSVCPALLAGRRCTTRVRVPAREPPRITRVNCCGELSLSVRGSTSEPYSLGHYAVSLARPLRRRAAMMARPARVRMRMRKPCLRARRRLLGW